MNAPAVQHRTCSTSPLALVHIFGARALNLVSLAQIHPKRLEVVAVQPFRMRYHRDRALKIHIPRCQLATVAPWKAFLTRAQ
jgi:hypothetical protein